ncbi:MAG: NAD(P)H-dependent oxidoreductase [Candidatus Bathyarchaeales archaeon]
MKILGVSSSNRSGGNSYFLLKEMFEDISPVEAKIVQIGELNIKPCELCFESCAIKPFKCAIKDDFHMLFEEMKSADGIISPAHSTFMFHQNFNQSLKELAA